MSDNHPATVDEGCLALLRQHGVHWIFVNASTGFPPIVEAHARNS